MHRFFGKQFTASLPIRRKLFLLRIGIGLLMGLVVGSTSVWIATLVLYGFAQENLKTTGRLLSGQVRQALLDAGHDLTEVAASKEMEKFFHTDREVILASLMQRHASKFDHMVYFDYNGRARMEMVRGRMTEAPSFPAAQNAFYKAVNTPNTVIIDGVILDPALNTPSIWFYYNYVDYFDNAMGILAASVSLESLAGHLEKRFALSPALALLVTDKKGTIAFAPAKADLGKPVASLLGRPACSLSPGQGEYFARQKAFGRSYLVSCHPVPELMWRIFVLKPSSGMYHALYLLFALVFLVTVASVTCGEILSRSLGIRIVEPVERLIRVISDILKSGNLTKRVEWASADEMGTLAGLFNAMLAKIDTEQVALREQRTRELEKEVIRRKEDQDRLRLAIAEARAATRAKSQFLANMSHEIRTPMNGIIGMAELVLDSKLDREQKEMIATINEEAANLLSIINTILDFSKIEAGKMELEYIPFNLRTLFEELAATFFISAVRKGLDFNAYMPPDIPESLVGDPGRLRQVLVNLAGNAVKFTPDGEVFIRIESVVESPKEVSLRFCVEDTGIGIAKEQQAVIFDSFSQADGSTTREYGGTGLGTTISKQLVEMMGGTIGFQDRPEGGTRFWFTATLQKDHDVPGREKRFMAPAGTRVLVADTSSTARRCISGYLEAMGCEQVPVTDGQEVLRALLKKDEIPVSLVLVDLRMQDEDGSRIALKIHSLVPQGTVPVIYLTSAWDSGLPQKNLSSEDPLPEGTYLLSKPVRLSELESVIRAALTNAPLLPALHLPEGGKEQTMADKGIRILLAEDYPANQEVAKRHLAAAGYEVTLAENGKQAVAFFRQERFDLVLMDIQMPLLDGYEATRQIREREGEAGRVPVIALTAHAVKGFREKCIDAGMDDYLPKPLAGRALIEMVEKWTTGSPKRLDRHEIKKKAGPGQKDLSAPVDMAAAMSEFRDDAVFYKQVFMMFIDSLKDRMDRLEQALDNLDFAEAAIQAHTIKGGAGNVSAMRFFEMSCSLEAACEKEDTDKTVRVLEDMKEEFLRLKDFGLTIGQSPSGKRG